MNRSTSLLIFSQKKLPTSTSSVFFAPKCPIKPLPCTSYNNNKRTELAGMHSLLAVTQTIIDDEFVPCFSILTMQQDILKISIIHILHFNCVQTKNLAIKLCQQSISSRQSINNNILFPFLVSSSSCTYR
jgi:hypothetical protein